MTQRPPDMNPSPAAVELAAFAVERDDAPAAADVVVAQRARERVRRYAARPWLVISERDGRLEKLVATRATEIVRAQDDERRALLVANGTAAGNSTAPEQALREANERSKAARPDLFRPHAERMAEARDAALVEATRTAPHLTAHLVGAATTGEAARSIASPVMSASTPHQRHTQFRHQLAPGETPEQWASALLAAYNAKDPAVGLAIRTIADSASAREDITAKWAAIYAPKPKRGAR